MPFGLPNFELSNIKARMIWDNRPVEKDVEVGLFEGWSIHEGTRCNEIPKTHPVGEEGDQWTMQTAQEAKAWCEENEDCVQYFNFYISIATIRHEFDWTFTMIAF